MSSSIRRPSVPAIRRPLAARLVTYGAVVVVTVAAACQRPTEPVTRVADHDVQVASVPSGAPVKSEAPYVAPPDSVARDTSSTRPNQQLIWW